MNESSNQMLSYCSPAWVTTNTSAALSAAQMYSQCPYGKRLPGDVTIPNDFSQQHAIEQFFIICSIGYSFVPHLILGVGGIELLIRRGTRELSFIVFTILVILTNEIFIKPQIHQQRPGAAWDGHGAPPIGTKGGSCSLTCGMPSSHAALSTGYLLLLVLDGVYRTIPSRQEMHALQRTETGTSTWPEEDFSFSSSRELRNRLTVAISQQANAKWPCCSLCWNVCVLTLFPISPQQAMTHRQFVYFFLWWFFVLAPVGLSRIVLRDHTGDQVMAGMLAGFVAALLWFVFVRYLQHRYNDRLGEKFLFCMTHNYPLPEFGVRHDVLIGTRKPQELEWYDNNQQLNEPREMGARDIELTKMFSGKSQNPHRPDRKEPRSPTGDELRTSARLSTKSQVWLSQGAQVTLHAQDSAASSSSQPRL